MTEGSINISVVMATYNGEAYIEKQLLSIISQTVEADEIIIADDGSTDSTTAIIEDIKAKSNVTIDFYINKTNLGYICNFYELIKKATGDYIFLSDQDDLWVNDKIERSLNFLRQTKSSLMCTDFELIDENGQLFEGTKGKKILTKMSLTGMQPIKKGVLDEKSCIRIWPLMWQNYFPGCTMCFTREIQKCFLKNFTELLPHDYQLVLNAASINGAYYCPEKLIKYRIHSNNTVGTNVLKKTGNRKIIPEMVRFINKIDYLTPVETFLFCIIYIFRIQKISSMRLKKKLDWLSEQE